VKAGADAGNGSGWTPEWLAHLAQASAWLWRGVEAQHRVATMKLVDSVAEQDILEDLLERSKPPLPSGAAGSHYLLATPFRYVSGWPSRFRAPGEPGIWYGAQQLETACAEVGYWRWRFARDSDALRTQAVLSEHTFFEAHVAGSIVDLTVPPWSRLEQRWMGPSDYSHCHALARAAREADVGWLRYRSVRDPQHRPCAAVLRLEALAIGDLTRQQTWACKTTEQLVLMRPLGFAAAGEALEFAFAAAD
jgi:hypothetical protein